MHIPSTNLTISSLRKYFETPKSLMVNALCKEVLISYIKCSKVLVISSTYTKGKKVMIPGVDKQIVINFGLQSQKLANVQ